MKPGILTLTTDFGLGGPYVAAMKGVLLDLAPGRNLSTSATRFRRKTSSKEALFWRPSSTFFPRVPFTWR